MTRSLSLLLTLVLFTSLLHAQTTASARLGPEILLPEAPLGDALLPSSIGSIVPEGDGYLVFWSRTDEGSIINPILATRVNAAGERVGEPVTLISNSDRVFGLRASRVPAGGYLVAWAEPDGVYAILLNDNLGARWPNRVRLSPLGERPEIACNSTQCAIATLRAGAISSSFVAFDGRLTGELTLVAERARMFSIAAIDEGFVVAYNREQPDLRVIVAAFDNSVRFTGQTVLDAALTNVVAASNGQYATVAWAHDNEVRAAIVSSLGQSTNPRRITLFKNGVSVAGIATSEAQHLVVLTDSSRDSGIGITGSIPATDLYGVRTTRALDPLDREAFAINIEPHASLPATVSSNGRDFLVGWNFASTSMPAAMQGRFVPVVAEGRVGAEQMLRHGAQPQNGAALAANGRGHLAAWIEPGGELHASITGRDGGTTAAVQIAESSGLMNVSAASDGNDYALAWLEFVTADGSEIRTKIAIVDGDDATVLRLIPIDAIPATRIVWTGSSYALLVRGGVTMYLVRLASDGTILEQAPLFQVDQNFRAGAIAAADGVMTIAWSTSGSGLWVATGTETANLTPRQISSRAPTSLALAARNGEAFLVSSDYVNGGVYATRLDRNGAKLDGFSGEPGVLLDAALTQYPVASLAYHNASWLALWRRNNGTLLGVRFDDAAIGAAFRVEPSGYIAQHFANTADDEVTILFGRVVSGMTVPTRLVLRELVDTATVPRRRAS
jgi:hypothetical protein